MRSVQWAATMACVVAVAKATSSADGVFECDTRGQRFGCPPGEYEDGDRLRCKASGRVMPWATEPVRSLAYRLAKGPREVGEAALRSEGSDAVDGEEDFYTPGELTAVHVAVREPGKQYRGILLQARDDRGRLVGEWDFSNVQPALVRHPPICAGSLMHANADRKPYLSTYYVRVPAGTGVIFVDALLKFGEANEGAFFLPGGGPLRLKEGQARNGDAAGTWVLAGEGESCAAACAARNKVCNARTLQAASMVDGAGAVMDPVVPCSSPWLKSCEGAGLWADTIGGCYSCFDAASAGADCDAVPPVSLGTRMCPCAESSGGGEVTPGSPPGIGVGGSPADAAAGCPNGILTGDACCEAQCGECGGRQCGKRPGGKKGCCVGKITRKGILCSDTGTAPCMIESGTGVQLSRDFLDSEEEGWDAYGTEYDEAAAGSPRATAAGGARAVMLAALFAALWNT